MKKVLLSLAVLATSLAVNSQTIPEKEPLQGEVSPSVSALKLAADLVKYGYETQTPLPLIDAMQIIIDNPTQPLGAEPKGTTANGDNDKKNGTVTLDIEKILVDAKAFAEGDEQMLALIEQVENDSQAPSRGAVNGPKRGAFRTYGGCYSDFDVSFVKGYLAEVLVCGDGDTDLDLYIYDSNGNLIAADTDYTDDCYVNWIPAWTGRYTIRVLNRGRVYNDYIILTN